MHSRERNQDGDLKKKELTAWPILEHFSKQIEEESFNWRILESYLTKPTKQTKTNSLYLTFALFSFFTFHPVCNLLHII